MTGFAPLTHLGVLLLSGSDAKRFLHGQCTQDVQGKAENEGGYAFLLDARGKNLGDFRFVIRGEGILCFLDRGRTAATRAWLDRFVIAADVRIADVSDEWTGLVVTGEGASSLLASVLRSTLPSREDHAQDARFLDGDLLVVKDDGFGGGFDAWASGPSRQASLGALTKELARQGAVPVDAAALDVLRIEAGRPRFGVDFDETATPAETGQADRAVSYTKGCYSGQEVVAKQKYLGKPRKTLTGVLAARPVATPAPILAGDGTEGGRLTSCAFSPRLGRAVGLAMMKSPVPEPGSAVTVQDAGESLPAEVASLPFIRPSSS